MKTLKVNLSDKAPTGIISLLAMLLSMLLLSACSKENQDPKEGPPGPKITLTKATDAKNGWTLYIEAAEADRAEIWVDLNSNGAKDNGEDITKFGREYADRNVFALGASKTIVLYGKVAVLYCHDSELAKLDVSKNTALKELSCMGNKLTELDISKNIALEKLNCFSNQLTALDLSGNTNIKNVQLYNNRISAANMTQLISSLPSRTVADDAALYVRQVNDNNSRPIATDIAAAKGKNWKLYEFVDGAGKTEL
ncbi:MAG: hypothetical protein KF746_12390 [Chitinophagaceae bacterium]|nr:hypothetical protein [Chitinophagaceae bacterium]